MLFDDFSQPLHYLKREIDLPGGSIRVPTCQVQVRITVTDPPQQQQDGDRGKLPKGAPWIWAVLDTGSSSTLSLTETQLRHFDSVLTRKDFIVESPVALRDASGNDQLLPKIRGDLWIHAVNPQSTKFAFYRIPLSNAGIPVYLSSPPIQGTHYTERSLSILRKQFPSIRLSSVRGPTLPVLGLHALCLGRMSAEFACTVNQIQVKLSIPDMQSGED